MGRLVEDTLTVEVWDGLAAERKYAHAGRNARTPHPSPPLAAASAAAVAGPLRRRSLLLLPLEVRVSTCCNSTSLWLHTTESGAAEPST